MYMNIVLMIVYMLSVNDDITGDMMSYDMKYGTPFVGKLSQ